MKDIEKKDLINKFKGNESFKKDKKSYLVSFLKKSKLSFLSITLMLVVAGYINYEYNPKREENLGQTIYVNGKDTTLLDVDIYDKVKNDNKGDDNKNISNVSNNEVNIYDEKSVGSFNYVKNTDKVKDEESKNKEKEVVSETIATFASDRDNMFSELTDNYTDIIESNNTSKDMVTEYQVKLDELLTKKNLIKMVENIIKSYGIEKVVIIPSTENYNVVIKSSKEIGDDIIAKITTLITDRFEVDASKVTVTNEKI